MACLVRQDFSSLCTWHKNFLTLHLKFARPNQQSKTFKNPNHVKAITSSTFLCAETIFAASFIHLFTK